MSRRDADSRLEHLLDVAERREREYVDTPRWRILLRHRRYWDWIIAARQVQEFEASLRRTRLAES